MTTDKIKALVVDDSLSIRLLIKGMLEKSGRVKVVATAEDGRDALQKIKEHQPDVITLDVEMPEMDGIECLKRIMSLRPTPVVMISTLTERGSRTALKALALGAIDVFGKPSQKSAEIAQYQDDIIRMVEAAAHARVQGYAPRAALKNKPPLHKPVLDEGMTKNILIDDFMTPVRKSREMGPCLAIGASTGGTEALKTFVEPLKAPCPPIFIVQHIAAGFSKAFAESLNKKTDLTVVEAKNGMTVEDNHIYIAPATHHLTVRGVGSLVRCNVIEGPRINRHKPSVDVLFRSVHEVYGTGAVGVVLTGMGDDGARGLKELKDMGATTYAQDEASSTVYGMPRAAKDMDAASHILPLKDIPHHIQKKGK